MLRGFLIFISTHIKLNADISQECYVSKLLHLTSCQHRLHHLVRNRQIKLTDASLLNCNLNWDINCFSDNVHLNLFNLKFLKK